MKRPMNIVAQDTIKAQPGGIKEKGNILARADIFTQSFSVAEPR